MAATESSTRAIAALDDLYRRHVGDVYRYTYAVLGNHADAEDVTQTTFVNALRALERGETPRNASHWLLAISHNLVRQRWRQAASRPTVVELVHDVPDEAAEESDVELDSLVRALQRIPPSQREALVMRELEGRPYGEIAELLGITTSALETLLFRARRSLAEELEKRRHVSERRARHLEAARRTPLAQGSEAARRAPRRLPRTAPGSPRRRSASGRRSRDWPCFRIPIGLALFKGVPGGERRGRADRRRREGRRGRRDRRRCRRRRGGRLGSGRRGRRRGRRASRRGRREGGCGRRRRHRRDRRRVPGREGRSGTSRRSRRPPRRRPRRRHRRRTEPPRFARGASSRAPSRRTEPSGGPRPHPGQGTRHGRRSWSA